MPNITMSLDEKLLRKGREYAKKHNTSLNNLIRILLQKTVASENENWLEECFDLMDKVAADSKGEKWTREIKAKVEIKGGTETILLAEDEEMILQMGKKFLEKYGIALGDDVIVDRLSRVFGGDYLIPVIMDYSSHPITKGFNVMSFFPLARSVDVVKKPPENVEAQVLAKTGKAAWAEVDLEEVKKGRAQFNEGKDKKGPVSVAVVANIKVKIKKKAGEEEAEEEEVETKKARIVVFGDSDFVTNANMGISGNGDLFLNTVSWLAEEENLISIRAKSTESQPIMLTARQGKVLFWIPVVLMPLAFLFQIILAPKSTM